MKQIRISRFPCFSLETLGLSLLLNGCLKDFPNKTIVYRNDFENKKSTGIDIYNVNGLVDTPTDSQFTGNPLTALVQKRK